MITLNGLNNFAVIGLGFGDEGKGLVTSWLCKNDFYYPREKRVIRFSGGQNSGHTVYSTGVANGFSHVFSNFGSGTLDKVKTYWSEYCTFDPVGFVNELQVLKSKSINPVIYINGKCPITTPYEKKLNQISNIDRHNGTCGVGINNTIIRENDFYSFKFEDIFYKPIFAEKMKMLENYYLLECSNLDLYLDLIEFNEAIEYIRDSINDGYIYIYDYYQNNFIRHNSYNIFEGSQGLLLDQHYGFFPNVTRSNTGTKNIIEMGFKPYVYLVTRAYQTRHGNGFMTNEHIPHNIKIDSRETNVDHLYQGKFRRSLLDLNLLRYAIDKDDYIRTTCNKALVITCLDHVVDEYRFTLNGQIVCCNDEKDFVNGIKKILGIDIIYVSKSPYSNCITKFDE